MFKVLFARTHFLSDSTLLLQVLLLCAIAVAAVQCQRATRRRVVRPAVSLSERTEPDPVDETPKPYSFAYEAVDPLTGSTSKREESSDGVTTRGSYSYTDPDGVFRVVDYTADENGYTANVRTNEPGTAAATAEQADPANVVYSVEPTPDAVVARYAASAARLTSRQF